MNELKGKIGKFFFAMFIATLATGCFKSEEQPETRLTGSVGDGPVIGAMVRVLDSTGSEVASDSSNSTASYSISVSAASDSFPLIIEASGGIDIVTSMPLDFTMKSVAMIQGSELTANINPFSTIIVETALRSPGGLSEATLAAATEAIVTHLNFGLDLSVLPDPVSGNITATNIATTVKASEALGETIRRVSDTLASSGINKSPDAIVSAIAADMVDGVLDGRGVNGVDPRIAAVTNTVAAQVAVENLSNDLVVLGTHAEALMDNAILVSMPGAPTSATTGNVRVNASQLDQAMRSLNAVSAYESSTETDNLISAVAEISVGATATSADQTLATTDATTLSEVSGRVARGNSSDHEKVNGRVRQGGGQSPSPSPSVNNAPEIFGTPVTSAQAGTSYFFQPSANDVDGDSLSFSVSNRPVWATFNTLTGALSGTPGDSDAGTTPSVVISVSDGQASASLAPFSITVTSTAAENNAPTISGTPATSVNAGNAYAFQPGAQDPDNDTLVFSISNKPVWATFDASNGQLSGTPGEGHVGVTQNIVISVSDGQATPALPAFSIEVLATESGLSATRVVQQQNNTGTLQEVTLASSSELLNGQVVSGLLRVRAQVSGPGLYCCQRYAFNSDGSISVDVGHNSAWTAAPVTAGSVHEFDTTTIPDGDYELYLEADNGTEVYIVFTVNNGGSPPPPPPENRAPTISGSPASGVLVGEAYAFQPQASDIDGDALSFSIANKPVWASFSASTGQLAGSPSATHVGVSGGITITVSDGQLSSSLGPFSISVSEPDPENRAPTMSGSPASGVLVGESYAFQPQASDPDGDTLSFTIANKPVWASFSTATGQLTGSPSASHVGVSGGITITVSDGQLSSSLGPFSISVSEPEPENRAPAIAGAPLDSVLADTPYSFVPSASDPDGDALQFSVVNLPQWASFNFATGEVSGTPSPADIGTYYDIVITVTDGTLDSSLPPFFIEVTDVATGIALLSWIPPTERVDGTPLDQLAGFRVFRGVSPSNLVEEADLNNANAVDHLFENLPAGIHYFAVLAYDSAGVESALSNIASKTIQ